MIPTRAAYFVCAVTAVLSGLFGAAVGYHEGDINGVRMAHAEGAHVSDHDRRMQRGGVCEFAKRVTEESYCNAAKP
jgi:hypothetical protein